MEPDKKHTKRHGARGVRRGLITLRGCARPRVGDPRLYALTGDGVVGCAFGAQDAHDPSFLRRLRFSSDRMLCDRRPARRVGCSAGGRRIPPLQAACLVAHGETDREQRTGELIRCDDGRVGMLGGRGAQAVDHAHRISAGDWRLSRRPSLAGRVGMRALAVQTASI